MNEAKRVNVIIVNYNGKQWLDGCIGTILNQTYTNYDVTVVDNLSSDDSVEYIRKHFPTVNIISNIKNDGFAEGNNIAMGEVNGDYLLLLNSDTESDPSLIENLVSGIERNSNIGCVQSKLVLLSDDKVTDSCGSFITPTTLLYHFGVLKNSNDAMYNVPQQLYSAKGACILLRRSLVDVIGLFDRKFWCYYEETDLCQRIWIAGYEVWYIPEAICKHAVGGTSLKFDNSKIMFHNFKNKLASHIKNFEILSLAWVLPMHFLTGAFYSIYFLFNGKWKSFVAFYHSIYWVLKNFRTILRDRRYIQSIRIVSDFSIFKKTMRSPGLTYYIMLFSGLKGYKDR
ncbi:MAG: Glycosyl transferase [Fluviibacter phosphoraccumulans EoVTN8]